MIRDIDYEEDFTTSMSLHKRQLSPEQLHKFEGPGVGLLGLAASPDGRYALASGKDGSVRLYRLPGAGAPAPKP